MISAAEARRLADLTEQSSDPRSRVAEHLVRVLLALSSKTKPDLQLAQQHAEMAVRVLLAKELEVR